MSVAEMSQVLHDYRVTNSADARKQMARLIDQLLTYTALDCCSRLKLRIAKHHLSQHWNTQAKTGS